MSACRRGRVALPRDRRCTSENFPLLITLGNSLSWVPCCSRFMDVQRRSRGSATLPHHTRRDADMPIRVFPPYADTKRENREGSAKIGTGQNAELGQNGELDLYLGSGGDTCRRVGVVGSRSRATGVARLKTFLCRLRWATLYLSYSLRANNLHRRGLPSRFAQTTADAAAIRCPDQ